MPCNSDYMNPTRREAELQETAKLLVYVKEKMGEEIPDDLLAASKDMYCSKDYVPQLCEAVCGLNEFWSSKIVYDGRSSTSRKLADWWDRHQAADFQRSLKAAEKSKKRKENQESLVQTAMSKLNKEELGALAKYFLNK